MLVYESPDCLGSSVLWGMKAGLLPYVSSFHLVEPKPLEEHIPATRIRRRPSHGTMD